MVSLAKPAHVEGIPKIDQPGSTADHIGNSEFGLAWRSMFADREPRVRNTVPRKYRHERLAGSVPKNINFLYSLKQSNSSAVSPTSE